MFGPGVDHAIESYMTPDRELLAVLQLFRKTNQIIFRYEIEEGPKIFENEIRGKKFTMYNDTVIGYNKSGDEIIRTKVEEPFHVRPNIHQNSI
jgi:nitrate reductase beta subunit